MNPTTSGDPTCAPDPSLLGVHDPRVDEFGNFKGRVHHTLTHSPDISKITQHKHEVATDTIFSDTPAIDSCVTMAHIFVGKRTLVTDVYPKNNLSTH